MLYDHIFNSCDTDSNDLVFRTQSRLTINLCFIPPQLPSSDNMSSSVTDDVYSSCVRTQLTTAKLKELASKVILYDSGI